MSRAIPVGERESQTLEFKSRAALAKPETVARAVVAMLNAEGGEVWVGLRDEGDVAVELEGIEDAEIARNRLHDSLVDRIDPSPDAREVRVEVVPAQRDVLRIEATPRKDRRPYALIVGQGRQYPIRVGARVRSLSRDEIGARFAGSMVSTPVATSEIEAAKQRLIAAREAVLAAGEAVLWIGLVPAFPDAELDFDAVRRSDLLIEPRLSESHGLYSWPAAFWGARLTGRLEVATRSAAGSTVLYWRTPWGDELSLDRAGALFARAPLVNFATGRLPYVEGDEPVLFPDRFIGWVVSAFRVLSRLHSDDRLWVRPHPGPDDSVSASLVVSGLAGWRLLPGLLPHPAAVPRLHGSLARRAHQDFVLESPLALKLGAIREEPDRCALRLLTRLYEAFGLFESDIPLFDRKTGRFDWSLAEAGMA